MATCTLKTGGRPPREIVAGGAVWSLHILRDPAGPPVYRASTDHAHYLEYGPRALVGGSLADILRQLASIEADYRDTVGAGG